MAKNDAKVTDNPKLKEKILSDGQISLYLEYYLGYTQVYDEKKAKNVIKHNRKKEFLSLYVWQAPRTPVERQQNKSTYELARKIRFEREQEFKESINGYRLKKDRNINFLDYFQTYNDSYTKKDYRMMVLTLNRFKDFLRDTEEYNKYVLSIRPEQITKDLVSDFVDYIQGRSKGEGAMNIFQKFKKVIKYAVDHDVILKNPCTGIVCKVDKQILRKEVLSMDEIQTLIKTHYQYESNEIRRAFIFCLYCGLRFCDVKDLTFENVDYSNRLLKFEQNKTKGHSAASGVVIPLNEGLLNLIGEKPSGGNKESKIFNLPTYQSCNKSLNRWVKHAKIDKHITWHCARHSFAVNILNNGANIKTVASLLGHSGLKHTEKYTRAIDSLKQDAINSLPELDL
ncbi:site-specific integrase [Parabacteroides sp.]|jgi:integrase/recombinase XerD|uniref:site-specific integrase n=1 Tax=Parabacteroides sp. TaxID=1869337 RepID=UPI00307FF77C